MKTQFFRSDPKPGGDRVYTLLRACWRNKACLLPATWDHRVVRSATTNTCSCQIHDSIDDDWLEVDEELDLHDALAWLVKEAAP